MERLRFVNMEKHLITVNYLYSTATRMMLCELRIFPNYNERHFKGTLKET